MEFKIESVQKENENLRQMIENE